MPAAVDLLIKWLNQGETVLVHCYQGVSRSATIVIAYLVKACEMDLTAAWRHCKEIRWLVCPNDGFFRALQKYQCEVRQEEPKADKILVEWNTFQARCLEGRMRYWKIENSKCYEALTSTKGDVEQAYKLLRASVEVQSD